MASYKWNGSAGSYLDPGQWTPAGVPLYGLDAIATIDAGTVTLSDAEPNGITLFLGGQTSPRLVLSNAAFGPEMTLDATYFATLEVDGYDSNFGTIAVGAPGAKMGTILTFGTSGYGQLNQYGTVTVGIASLLVVDAHTFLNNDGLIELIGGNVSTAEAISGHGTIELAAAASTMSVHAAVGSGQTFELRKGSLVVDDYNTFQGRVADFTSSAASLNLGKIKFDAATYAQDANGEHLILTSSGLVTGEIQLDQTPDTQYTVTQNGGNTVITPSQIYSDGSIPSSIIDGTVTLRNAEPNGQTVALGGPGFSGQSGGPNLVLDNAALGPTLVLTVASPAATGTQNATITVQGYDTNYGEIDVIPSADAQSSGNGNTLMIKFQPGSQLNQEGTIRVTSPQAITSQGSVLAVTGPGTLNNDGQIYIGPGSFAVIDGRTTGAGTITIDHAGADLFSVASTQTVDFLGGSINTSIPTFNATIKDWDSHGVLIFNGFVSSVQFNQTSIAGGDLQVFGGSAQVGDLHLLGTYATSDFNIIHGHTNVGISVGGTFGGLG